MRSSTPGLVLLAASLSFLGLGCGGGAAAASGGTTGGASAAIAPSGPPRPGGAVDLIGLVPANAAVVLHADLGAVRQDAARYDRIAGELATELGLAAETATVRELLDRTDSAVGAFTPGADGAQLEGMLVFAGRYAESDFEHALSMASARHGSTPAPSNGGDGRHVYAMGSATIAQLDQWTWAVAVGPVMRAHLEQVAIGGGRAFGTALLEFGPRIGLPRGSAQAWADQDQQAGVDMVALVFAGENPQMVHDFVATVQRHLGL